MNLSEKPFSSMHLRVSVLHWPPWVRLNITKNEDGSEDVNMAGPMANMFDVLLNDMGFTYSIFSPEEVQWGVALPGGNWTGLVGTLHHNKADMVLGPVAMTHDRALVSSFTAQLSTEYLTILAGFPDVVEASVFGTLMAFEWKVWLGLLCSMLICVFTNFVVDICVEDSKKTAAQRLMENWWMYFSAFFSESSPRTPTNIPGRIVFAVWWLTILVLMNAFTGHMKATMMVRPEPERIDSMKDLSTHPSMRTLTWKGSAYEALLKNSKDVKEYQAVWKLVARSNGTLETTALFSIDNLRSVLRGKTVIVCDITTLLYHVSLTCSSLRDGRYYFAKEQFFPHIFAIALKKGSNRRFTEFLNKRVQWVVESGLLQAWMNQEYGDLAACAVGHKEDTFSPLSMFEVQSVFLVYLMFTAVSVVAFLGEVAFAGSRKCRRKPQNVVKINLVTDFVIHDKKKTPTVKAAEIKKKQPDRYGLPRMAFRTSRNPRLLVTPN